MTDQKISDVSNSVVWDSRGGPIPRAWRRDNGGLIYPGYVVTGEGESSPDISPADLDDTECAFGVADCDEGHDIDTAYTDNDWVPVIPCGTGIGVYVFRSATCGCAAVYDGTTIHTNYEAGKVYASTTVDDGYVGRCQAYEAAGITDDVILKIYLGL